MGARKWFVDGKIKSPDLMKKITKQKTLEGAIEVLENFECVVEYREEDAREDSQN